MKKLFTIIVLAAVAQTVVAQKPKLAVYMTGDDPINEIVSSRLVDDFARSSEYTIVERTSSFLAELNKEHAYERTGEVDDEQIAALGRQFNVQYICVTSVIDVWNTEKYITARIIDAETAEVVASCSSNGSVQNSSELIGALNTLSNNFSKAVGSIKQNDAKKVAVYVTKTGNRDVDVVLGDQLVSGFAKSGRYVAIERTNGFLKKLKEEQGYQQSGAVADDDLTRWGQQFGVQYVCIIKSTAWSGDYFITTRMIDVKTGEVVNSYKVEGRTLSNSEDVVRVAQEIASELSKGTLAEQAKDAQLKKDAEESRIRVEEEAKRRAEREAREKAEQDEIIQKKALAARKKELQEQLSKGYLIIEHKNAEWMVCIDPLTNVYGSEVRKRNYYSCYGYNDWQIIGDVVSVSIHARMVLSEIKHYLGITIPLCTNGLDFWEFTETKNGSILLSRMDNWKFEVSGKDNFLDGEDKSYIWHLSGCTREKDPYYNYHMNTKKANAILMRKVR
jgi:TolB-like protein